MHSRVARSNIYLLNKLGAKVRVICPPTLLPPNIEELGVKVFKNLEDGLNNVDIIMVLRIQKERMSGSFVPSEKEFFKFWGLDRKKLNIIIENIKQGKKIEPGSYKGRKSSAPENNRNTLNRK